MALPTTYTDFDGNMICVGNVLRDKYGDLAMVFGDNKSGYHLSTNRCGRDLTELSHWAESLDDVIVTEMQLRIDRGCWMVFRMINSTFHTTYEEAKMSDLFGQPDISYLSQKDILDIQRLGNMLSEEE